MIESIDSIKKYLGELATVLNAFKSEAVQLRVLDYVLNQPPLGGTDTNGAELVHPENPAQRAPRPTEQRRGQFPQSERKPPQARVLPRP